ncbi:MAG: SUMF1/EgtB/PvdO family nonheme iron enzyme [Planctomycetes bacterium]|nr:SUMF1/EgtB/PvdO family nonheme iron enzyme [Planctomycetota bacterium]
MIGAPEERYQILGFIGEGGMGEVFRATDRLLGREVAIKYLKTSTEPEAKRLRGFWDEVSTAGLLDHPNIPPVFDVGLDAQSRLFYVMKLIRGVSLREHLQSERPPLLSALSLFTQVCAAVEFAHSRGILHLDLKPDNVMVGAYGEVYLVDWGLSRRSLPDGRTGGPHPIRGTPAYMSPEQSRRDAIPTEQSDVFSLGVLLYELTTRRHPFLGTDSPDSGTILDRIRLGQFLRSPSWRDLPLDLREVIRAALEPDPRRRTSSVEELGRQVRGVLSGARERERKARLARQSFEQALAEIAASRSTVSRLRDLEARVQSEEPQSWEPVERKRGFWALEDELEHVRSLLDGQNERALDRLREAHDLAPHDDEIRGRLTQSTIDRFREAETEGRTYEVRVIEADLRRIGGPRVRRFLQGDGHLALLCDPMPSRAVLYTLTEEDRRLVPTSGHDVTGSLTGMDLPMGRYWIRCEHEGMVPIEAPILIPREQEVELQWRFRTREAVGPDFVRVPPSTFVMGGDDRTFMSVPRQEPWVGDFCIARFPVTWAEYLTYLEDLADRDPESLRRQLPATLSDGQRTWFIDDQGRPRCAREPSVALARSRWPVFDVNYRQVLAYVDWRSRRDDRRYALPTDEEWEKAARGVDARVFPWGNHYDATFCKNSGSTEHATQPEPVGTYENDCSPYGVRDLAGGIREWCSSWFSEQNNFRLVRGGSWNFGEIGAHAAYRLGCTPEVSYPFIGFRLVHHYERWIGDPD